MRAVPALVAGLVVLACNREPPRVPVQASRAEIAALAGEWRGEYAVANGGRSGAILFRLTAGVDTARGDVLMTFHRPGRPSEGEPTGLEPRSHPGPDSRLLTIRFVRGESGFVTGELDPYEDPECGCTLQTTFVGRVRGDVIEGSFRSVHSAGHSPTSGRWRVERHVD